MAVRATFDSKPPPGCINFGIGQPSNDLTPPALFAGLCERYNAVAEPEDFNYGDLRGDPKFIASLAGFVERAYGMPVEPANLFLTGGNSQALDLVCQRFTKPGDTVFVEEPCYFLAYQILIDHGLEIVPIPMDTDGMRMDAFEEALRRHRPTLAYTIPSFNNPTGLTLSRERRERLADLSREHGFVVAADEVYQLLSYEGVAPPAMGTLIGRGNVISMGSFAKILAPGLRAGWIQADAALVDRILESGWVTSGGAVNQVVSLIVAQAIDAGVQERHLEHLRQVLRARRDAMHEALLTHFSGMATWRLPPGGYFFWVEMDGDLVTAPLKPVAMAAGVGFQPGNAFSGPGGFRNCLRLSFAHYDEAEIAEGIARLATVLKGAR